MAKNKSYLKQELDNAIEKFKFYSSFTFDLKKNNNISIKELKEKIDDSYAHLLIAFNEYGGESISILDNKLKEFKEQSDLNIENYINIQKQYEEMTKNK